MSLTPIAPETASPSPTTLILKEKAAWKSLSNDSGKIKDTDGNLVFDIDAALMTMSERRTLKDAAGKAVGQVRRKKTPGLHPAMYIGTMEEEKKCMVKTKGLLNPTKWYYTLSSYLQLNAYPNYPQSNYLNILFLPIFSHTPILPVFLSITLATLTFISAMLSSARRLAIGEPRATRSPWMGRR